MSHACCCHVTGMQCYIKTLKQELSFSCSWDKMLWMAGSLLKYETIISRSKQTSNIRNVLYQLGAHVNPTDSDHFTILATYHADTNAMKMSSRLYTSFNVDHRSGRNLMTQYGCT
jgi:uncharacterized protein YhjY with autotransporter beta-barrel domain